MDEGQTVECYADIMVLVDEGEEYREEAAEPKKAQGNAPQAGVRRMQLPKIGVNMTEAVITKVARAARRYGERGRSGHRGGNG